MIPRRAQTEANSSHHNQRYRGRHLVENAYRCRKDFRRVVTRYDKLAADFLSAAALATAIVFWL